MIAIDRLTYAYRRTGTTILDHFSAGFPPASLTAITGPNACGKTTLTKLVVGIERPLAGRILVDDIDIATLSLAEIGERVGYVYQHPAHQLFCTSVRDEVAYGLRNLGLPDVEVEERIRESLAAFDLSARVDEFPLHLSHGEKQRLMLATVLAMRPAYVILDEPTTGLDVVRRRALGAYLRRIVDDGCGVIVVSHESSFVSRYADGEVRMTAPKPAAVSTAAEPMREPPAYRPRRTMLLDLSSFDPRTKIMLMLCISTLAVIWQDPRWLAGLLAFTCAAVALGRVGFRAALRQAKGILNVIALLFLVQCLFVRSGPALLSVHGFTLVTADGVFTALGVALRLAIVVFSALVILTGDARDYLLALVKCRVPYEIAFMVMIAVHFLPILRDEALDVYYAVQMRGTEVAKASLRGKLRVYTRIALPIVAGAIKRAEQTSIAMEARAFRAHPQRTFMRGLQLARYDVVCLVALPLLTGASLALSQTV